MSVDALVMSEETASALASIQKCLLRMEEKLSGVTAGIEDLKKAAKPPEAERNSGLVHSTPVLEATDEF